MAQEVQNTKFSLIIDEHRVPLPTTRRTAIVVQLSSSPDSRLLRDKKTVADLQVSSVSRICFVDIIYNTFPRRITILFVSKSHPLRPFIDGRDFDCETRLKKRIACVEMYLNVKQTAHQRFIATTRSTRVRRSVIIFEKQATRLQQ